ncbi:hypothetical protein OUZ56_029893 [Daphnia magna]|uniref:Uncharacterized protein n=1 Tax=Daphnia magna TaxID=35525 RepID=A0ABR0B847_9CRUS|nr:hypothetical protein OUZ56_029893 [Daphnia magna]
MVKYSGYLKYRNALENLMGKRDFLGAPKYSAFGSAIRGVLNPSPKYRNTRESLMEMWLLLRPLISELFLDALRGWSIVRSLFSVVNN